MNESWENSGVCRRWVSLRMHRSEGFDGGVASTGSLFLMFADFLGIMFLKADFYLLQKEADHQNEKIFVRAKTGKAERLRH